MRALLDEDGAHDFTGDRAVNPNAGDELSGIVSRAASDAIDLGKLNISANAKAHTVWEKYRDARIWRANASASNEYINDIIITAARTIEAWDSTVLPRSRDGMLQERMEDLRAALTPNAPAKRGAESGSALGDELGGKKKKD
jgi:hypothetical protein